MSEKQAVDKKRVLMYVLAVVIIVAIVWVILRGTNVFNYAENYGNAIEAQQESEE
jgi:t-SNARE complex subunit (syntaxin)